MIEKLESFDQQLFLYLNGLHTSWLDTLMYLVSQGWFWFPLFAFFIFHLAKRYPGSRNRIIVFGTLALTVGLTDGASTWVIKKQVKRYRPTHNLEIGHEVHTVTDFSGQEYRGGKYGFVSSHSANYFGIATVLFWLMGHAKRWRWLFVWAALIAYSRIYLGVHYPSDIIGGTLVGVIMGIITGYYSQKLFTFDP